MPFKVEARRSGAKPNEVVGYYGHRRRRQGEEFEITHEIHFSSNWMHPIGWAPKLNSKGKPALLNPEKSKKVETPDSTTKVETPVVPAAVPAAGAPEAHTDDLI